LVLPAAAVIALAGCADAGRQSPPGQTPPAAAPAPSGYVDLVERLSPSVVTLQLDGGLGSGVVLRSDVVVTNAHVVAGRREVTVEFADGTSSPGAVLATDVVTDLAVVRTQRTDLPVPAYRTELPRPGETAIAIGSPLGFQNSVTVGVISGLHRDIPGAAAQSASLVDLIQTDASISPGNSGGALLDANGRVVGINEAYIPPAAGAVSLGFAIPSATVLDVTEQLLTTGRAIHPFLGVSVGPLTPAIRELNGMSTEHGALVLGLDGGAPVASAGIRPGDVIIELAGSPVRSVEDLLSVLRRTDPGSAQPIVFMRGDRRLEATVTIGSRTG
jgi:S1-C subfamily serine protease